MGAMSIVVSSDIIGVTVEGTKIVKTIVTATNTNTGGVAVAINAVKKFKTQTSGWGGFIMATTSSQAAVGPAVIPIVLSGTAYTNQIAITPSGASNGAVFRFLVFGEDD